MAAQPVVTKPFPQKFNELFSESGLTQYTGNEMSNDKQISYDFNIIYKDYSMESLSIFNTQILPLIVTDRIDHRWWWMRFDKVGLAKNPIGGTANKITYSVEERKKSSERLGAGVEISLMELLTPEGRDRGLKSIQRLVSAFVETTAMKACEELAEKEPRVDVRFYTTNLIETDDQILRVMELEKNETFISIKSETGFFALIEEKKSQFAMLNANTLPDTLIYNAAKHGLFKYGNARTSESYRNGPESDGILFSAKHFEPINGLDVVGVPKFPTDQESGNMTLLSTQFAIGSVMMYDESKFQPVNGVITDKRVINIYSQQADGPVEISLEDIINNLSCWDEKTGNLHDNYKTDLIGNDDVFKKSGGGVVEKFGDFDDEKVPSGFKESAKTAGAFGENVTRDTLKTYVQKGMMLPFKVLLMKPNQLYETSPLIILKKGSELGNTVIAFNKETSGINAKNELLYVQCNRFIAALITDPFKRCIIPNVFIEKVISGHGAKFVDDALWKDFKLTGKNKKNFSIMTAVVPYSHNDLDTETGWIDMCGKFKKMSHAKAWVGSEAFVARYGLESLKSKQSLPPLACADNSTRKYPNRVLWWGAQTMGKMADTGIFQVNNMGHTGSICSRGDKAALDHGNQLKVFH